MGCGVYAEVQEGIWTKQEPAFDHPINRGAHCAKGASLRQHGHSTRRLKYPMKLVAGEWQRLSWDDAVNEIGDKLLELRDAYGPDSVYWLGSAKFNNEQAYLMRKLASMWGTNNTDHQARICHSTTVAGVANTWGYGAMTNSLNDMHNSRSMLFIGSNPSEAHPVAMQHILIAKERNSCDIIVADPRFTRTAAKANKYVRIRPGSDVAYIWGLLWHIFENGWEDREYINQRVYGMDDVRAEVAQFTPSVVEDITGVPEAEMFDVAKRLSDNRPGCVVWCMGAPSTPPAITIPAPTAFWSWHWVTSASRAAEPTSCAATTTYKAPLTWGWAATRCRAITAWPKVPGSTGPRCGTWSTTG